MKKVLLAFDGEHFSQGVFEFVKQMNKHQPVLAIGIFLPAVDYAELLYSYGGVPAGPLYINDVITADEALVQKNIGIFKELCEQNGIEYRIHSDTTTPIVNSLKEETRFADLLVLNSRSFFENTGPTVQEDYITNVTHKAECPVVLVPGDYKEPQNIILAYDGSTQSIFAIKQFSYLFPHYSGLKALLVYFTDTDEAIPERHKIEELMQCYYNHCTITKLKITDQKEIEEWMSANGNSMIVAGAHGRPMVSEFFKKSFVTTILRDHKLPVFVTHK